jgi:hypothetical protein
MKKEQYGESSMAYPVRMSPKSKFHVIWRLAGLVVWVPDYETRGPGFKSR